VTTTGTFTAVASPTNGNVNVFFGIRYAAPPVGTLRWKPPIAPTPSSGPIVAANPGNPCPQPGGVSYFGDEDCLFLNVWAPANATPGSKLPVFFWIHGGGLLFGDSSTYDPSILVQTSNIIVVTVNYRLGALGWLVEAGLTASAASAFEKVGDSGNYGLMDQQFAMQWVQSNIAGFGGDPARVTIGGESAGGLSVTAHLASTTTAVGLFRAAIIESGAYTFHEVPTQSAYQTSFSQAFDSQVGCTQPSDASCLRARTVADIVAAQTPVFGSFGISPVTGTKILPISLPTALSNGHFIQVPILQGTNANEGAFFEPGMFPAASGVTASDIAAAGGPANYDLANANGTCASGGMNQICSYSQEVSVFLRILGLNQGSSFNSTIAADYPLASFPDRYLPANAPSSDAALSQIYTDLVFACNAYDSNIALSQFVNVFAYEFNDPNAPPYAGSDAVLQAPNDIDGFSTGSEHTAELPFLFVESGVNYALDANEQQLATELRAYWGNFIVSGNPNTGISSSSWPAFSVSNQNVQSLVPAPQSPATVTSFGSKHFCSTWEPTLAAQ
jgi:para-nitrobenzyl esterase